MVPYMCRCTSSHSSATWLLFSACSLTACSSCCSPLAEAANPHRASTSSAHGNETFGRFLKNASFSRRVSRASLVICFMYSGSENARLNSCRRSTAPSRVSCTVAGRISSGKAAVRSSGTSASSLEAKAGCSVLICATATSSGCSPPLSVLNTPCLNARPSATRCRRSALLPESCSRRRLVLTSCKMRSRSSRPTAMAQIFSKASSAACSRPSPSKAQALRNQALWSSSSMRKASSAKSRASVQSSSFKQA
mmetsp:Transcript_21252/g.49280  ORF Transcript_21252/g.49280 Transcript_21252/m.49280 type:complete len:251 (-) Transcript_21252:1161-1913(-)